MKLKWNDKGKAGAVNDLRVLRCEVRGASEIKLEKNIWEWVLEFKILKVK